MLDSLKKDFASGSFIYADHAMKFGRAVRSHFGNVDKRVYGVHIVRQRNTEEVLYIGKGGTVDGQGQFKGQDVPGRLGNVKESRIRATEWFRQFLQERGTLVVEYLVVEPPFAPAYIEATLLQAYLAEHKRLPPKNRSL